MKKKKYFGKSVVSCPRSNIQTVLNGDRKMAEILIYTTKTCPYCVRAKMLFDKKGVSYKELDASDEKIREDMIQKTGGKRTVPQIFINGRYIGGSDDLYALESKNELDTLLE